MEDVILYALFGLIEIVDHVLYYSKEHIREHYITTGHLMSLNHTKTVVLSLCHETR